MSFASVVARLASVAGCIALVAPASHAQQATGTPSACAARSDLPSAASVAPDSDSVRRRGVTAAVRDTGHVALRILASATADEVRFVGSPRVCVTLTGDAQLDSVHVLGRRNITSPVVSNTSYRNVYVAVEILGRLNAECISARITGSATGGGAALSCASAGARGGAGASPP